MEKLPEKCDVCRSVYWCGRPCRNAPIDQARYNQAKAGPAPVSPAPPPHRPYKDGKGYSPRTQLYDHNCLWCGKAFRGSLDKSYCSDSCRVTSWRAKKKVGEKAAHIGSRNHHGWSQRRFAVLERDGFKCRYCGRGSKQNAVLHIDHVLPRAAGGSDDIDNLMTACMECNVGKGFAQIEYVPE